MIRLFAASLIILSFSVEALASSKVCFGSTKSDDTKGVVFEVEIDAQQISLKTIKTGRGQVFVDDYYKEGTYPAFYSSVEGGNGKTYLKYKGENTEYQDVILVDEALLKSHTTGLLKIRATSEIFFNAVFFCKD